MHIHNLRRWDVSPGEAVHLQEQLRSRVVVENRLGVVRQCEVKP
jgi:hypothetical protein